MKTSDNSKLWHALVLLIVLAVIIVISPRIIPAEHPNMDLNKYRAMASAAPGIAVDIPRPFAYRLLGPYIVGLLPLDVDTSFYLMALVLSYALLLLFYRFLCFMGIESRIALLTTVMYALNYYQFNYHVYNYFQVVDLLGLICILVLLKAMLTHRWIVFSVTLFAGVLCRETPLIMIPVAFAYLIEQRSLKTDALKFLVAVFPAIAIFVIIRLVIPYSGGMGLFQAFSVHIAKLKNPTTWLNIFVRPYTPLTFLLVVFFRDTTNFFREKKYMIFLFFLVALSTLFGTDTERLMAPAFVVFYVPIAIIFQRYTRQNRLFMIFLLVIVFIRTFYYIVAPNLLPSVNSERLAATVPAIIVAVAGYWFKTKSSKLKLDAESSSA